MHNDITKKETTYQTPANPKNNQIRTSQEHLPPRLRIPSFIQEQPEDAAHSVCPAPYHISDGHNHYLSRNNSWETHK